MRVTEAERDLIAEKMTVANIRNREAYLRKMAMDGYVVRLDLADVRKMVFLLQNATNNLNQIARRANETEAFTRAISRTCRSIITCYGSRLRPSCAGLRKYRSDGAAVG